MTAKILPLKLRAKKLAEIPIDLLDPPLVRLRNEDEDEGITQLAASLRQGTIIPLIVRASSDGRYAIISGWRRYLAGKQAGLDSLPVLVREELANSSNAQHLDDLLLAIADNLHRKDLDPFEEARLYLILMNQFGLLEDQIASRVSKTSTHVLSRINLLRQPAVIQDQIASRELSLAAADQLAHVQDEKLRQELATSAAEGGLAPSDLRALIKESLEEENDRPIPKGNTRLNIDKLVGRILNLAIWLERIFHLIEFRNLEQGGRQRLVNAIAKLITILERIKHGLATSTIQTGSRITTSTGNIQNARNAYQEWSVRDLDLIMDYSISLKKLAELTGRTVSAVKEMRKQMRAKRKKK